MGWTGDAQVFVRTASYNMNVAPFFNKWLVDLEDGQDGQRVISFNSAQVIQ